MQFGLVDGASIVKGPEMVCEMSRHSYTLPDLETDQCDAFLRCEKGLITQEICEDGLVYHMSDNLCDMPQRVDCSGRSRLQPPKGFYSFPKWKLFLWFLKIENLNINYIIGSGNCPRLNGLYPHSEFCDQYYFCRIGIPLLITCPTGLVYDLKAGVCQYPDEALRDGCMPEEVLGFKCPANFTNNPSLPFGDHVRYAKPDDCRYFFKCLKNGYPRLGGCEVGVRKIIFLSLYNFWTN